MVSGHVAPLMRYSLTVENIEPWLSRSRQPHGDPSPEFIFCAVGAALTSWESIQGEISIAYIGLIQPEKNIKRTNIPRSCENPKIRIG